MRMIFITSLFIFFSFISFSQQINSGLKFETGQTMNITMQVKSFITQHTGGQAIDFTMDATGEHVYTIRDVTKDSMTLHHGFRSISFRFDGWGRKMNFDSKNETDLNGIYGRSIKEMLEKTYDITIDASGKVLSTVPQKIQLSEADSRMAAINNAMKEILEQVQPPQKGQQVLLKVPYDPTIKGATKIVHPFEGSGGNYNGTYIISAWDDSTMTLDFTTSSVTVTKAESMGNETVTTMNNKSSGKIILDRITSVIKEKTETIESNGESVSSLGTLPVSSKTFITITTSRGKKE